MPDDPKRLHASTTKPAYTIISRSTAAGGRCAIRRTSWCAWPSTGRARERWCGGSRR